MAGARHEIIVFSDAATLFALDAVKKLVRHFADPHVGVVCGALQFRGSAESRQTEGVYWGYESMIRLMESRLGVTLSGSGAIYALRRQCFVPLAADTLVEDLVVPMNARALGFRVLYDPEARATDFAASTVAGEFTRRVRIATGSFQVLGQLLRAPLDARTIRLLSHKVLRWIIPFLLIGILVSSASLCSSPSTGRVPGPGPLLCVGRSRLVLRARVQRVRYMLLATIWSRCIWPFWWASCTSFSVTMRRGWRARELIAAGVADGICHEAARFWICLSARLQRGPACAPTTWTAWIPSPGARLRSLRVDYPIVPGSRGSWARRLRRELGDDGTGPDGSARLGERTRESEVGFGLKTGLKPEDVRPMVLDPALGLGVTRSGGPGWGAEVVGIAPRGRSRGRREPPRPTRGAPGQADIFALTVPDETFDVAYSIGVRHHTPDTAGAFRRVAAMVKKVRAARGVHLPGRRSRALLLPTLPGHHARAYRARSLLGFGDGDPALLPASGADHRARVAGL